MQSSKGKNKHYCTRRNIMDASREIDKNGCTIMYPGDERRSQKIALSPLSYPEKK